MKKLHRHLLHVITIQCRTPTIFRPAVARFVCERYCPPGGTVYVGTDVEPFTVEGNARLAQVLGYAAALHCTPAETFDPPKINLVFTSPPYFDRERYSQAKSQSWRRYATLDAWVAGFLRPVTERAYRALSRGEHFVVNIADLKTRGGTVPHIERTIGAAQEVDFTHIETLIMPLAAINKRSPTESVLVFRK